LESATLRLRVFLAEVSGAYMLDGEGIVIPQRSDSHDLQMDGNRLHIKS
jgi:hypothetical protein